MLDYDIREMYEDMELRLIKSMKRNLQLHLDEEDETGFKYPQWQAMKLKELKRYQRQNKDIVGHDTKGFSSSISKYLKKELREGSYNALKDYKDAMGDKYKANKTLSNSFFRINDKKVNSLINSVNNDLKTANKAVLRMTNDQYRKVIFQSQLYVANGVMTPKQAIDAANKDFLRRGLNVIEYKDGKRVNIASYSQMAIRTAGQRAMLMGEGAFRKKMKQHLIKISAHGTSCELCIPWQGKVLIDDVYSGGSPKDGKYPLVSEAMEQGLFHPNCRHGISTYFGGKDDISDINESYANDEDGYDSDAQYADDMNYIDRKIREYNRLATGSLDETNVKTYRNKQREWEHKKKEKVLEKLKKQPKTIPDKFIPAKDIVEVEARMGQLLGTNNHKLNKMNLELANEYLEGMEMFLKEYPMMKDYTMSINTKINPREAAHYGISFKRENGGAKITGTELSLRNPKDYKKFLESINYSIEKGVMYKGNTSISTMVHELTHGLEFKAGSILKGTFKDGEFVTANISHSESVYTPLANTIIKDAKMELFGKEVGRDVYEEIKYLGSYSLTNSTEMLAQCISYEMTVGTKPFSAKVKELFDKKIKEVFK